MGIKFVNMPFKAVTAIKILPPTALRNSPINVDDNAEIDIYYDNVILLTHFDNSLDSHIGPSWVVNGSEAYTSNSKFGLDALELDNLDYAVVPHNSNFNFNDIDFTVELWIKMKTNLSSSGWTEFRIIGAQDSGPKYPWGIRVFDYNNTAAPQTNNVQFICSHDGQDLKTITANDVSINEWHHVAFCRVDSTNTMYGFVDGVLIGQRNDVTNINVNNANIRLGSQFGNNSNVVYDSVRITKGVARYTADFTPPTGPFPTQTTVSPNVATISNRIFSGENLTVAPPHGAASNPFDDSNSRFWFPSTPGTSQSGVAYIGQDFGIGNEKAISRILFVQAGVGDNDTDRMVPSALIQHSDDNVNWVTIKTVSLSMVSGFEENIIIDSPPIKRYWRILANSNTTLFPWHVQKIEMYE